jgi:putative oxidoreductase
MDRVVARYPVLVDAALLVIRVAVGVAGVLHGSQKLFGAFGGVGMKGFAKMLGESLHMPVPEVSAWAAALGEFGGGLLVLLGFLPRIGALFFMLTMLVAWGTAHHFKYFAPAGGELPLNLAAMLLAVVLAGAGRFSLAGAVREMRRAA